MSASRRPGSRLFVVVGALFAVLAAGWPTLAAAQSPYSLASSVLEWRVDEIAPTVATELPWLDPGDFRYDSDRTVAWNTRYRAGRGSVGMYAEFHKFTAIERANDTYLAGADFEQFYNAIVLEGTLAPGLTLFMEAGYNITSVRPKGELRYDRYAFGYSFGAGASASADLAGIANFILDATFRTHEHNTRDGLNTFVVRNAGAEVNLREYAFAVEARFLINLVGEKDGLNLALIAGGAWHLIEGRVQGPLATLYYEPMVSRQFDVIAGVLLGVEQNFVLTAEMKFVGVIAPRITIELYF